MRNMGLSTRGARQAWAGIFVLVGLTFAAGGYFHYQVAREDIRWMKHEELAAIGELKVRQMVQMRGERVSDTRFLAESPLFREALEQWLRRPETPGLRQGLRNQLTLFLETHGYADALLLAPNGTVLLAAKDDPDPLAPATQMIVQGALAGHQAVWSDFYRNAHGIVQIDTAAAVFNIEGRPVAVVVLRSDAATELYPLIQSWPTPSRSAETLLVQRKGEAVVYLNELRHRANTALSMYHPLTALDIPAVQAALGKRGFFEGKDYRGVAVVAELLAVPESPWLLVAHVDKSEILAGVRYEAEVTLLFVIVLAVIAALVIAYAYQKRQLALCRDLAHSEGEKLEAIDHYERLIKLDEMKDEFLRIASHDLKNPLSCILGFASTLDRHASLDMPLTEEAHFVCTRIVANCQIMQQIIEDFFDFQALEDGELKLSREVVEINNLAREVLERNAGNATKKAIRLKLELDSGALLVKADKVRIDQVLENLVSNAIKFSPGGGELTVCTRKTNGWIRVEVRDSGPGIADEEMHKLFVKYAKLSNAPTGGEKSSGLGLTICKKLIELHDGRLEVCNNSMGGATFSFELPGMQEA